MTCSAHDLATAGRGFGALLTLPTAQAKARKGLAHNVRTAMLHLAPADLADARSVCPWSTAGCRAACLHTAGRGGIGASEDGRSGNSVIDARMARTRLFWSNRDAFVALLEEEWRRFRVSVARRGLGETWILRPNATSDIAWESIAPQILRHGAYDYTKSRKRALREAASRRGEDDAWPVGYSLTYSASEADSHFDLAYLMDKGVGVAMVFDAATHARILALGRWRGMPVVDGDAHDLRYLDRVEHGIHPHGGYVVALRAKGRAKADASGFVRRSIP